MACTRAIISLEVEWSERAVMWLPLHGQSQACRGFLYHAKLFAQGHQASPDFKQRRRTGSLPDPPSARLKSLGSGLRHQNGIDNMDYAIRLIDVWDRHS